MLRGSRLWLAEVSISKTNFNASANNYKGQSHSALILLYRAVPLPTVDEDVEMS